MIYTDRLDYNMGWIAYGDAYDGAPDADPIVGYGDSEDDAIDAFIIEALERDYEWKELA